MNLLGVAFRNLLRRPGRSVFTLLGVALAVASYITLAGLSEGMIDGAAVGMRERGVDLLVSRKGMVEVFGGALPQALSAQIAAKPGVKEVTPELVSLMELGDGVQAVVTGWDPNGFAFREMNLRSGRLPVAGAKEVILGDVLAETLHAGLGSAVVLNFETYKVVGIAQFGTGLLRGMAVTPLSDLQALLTQQGRVTYFQVRLDQPDAASQKRLAAVIGGLRPDLLVATSDDAIRGNKALAMLSAASLAIALVAMAMAALSVLNTLAMAVEERVREIGILAAIGWPRERILVMIVLEGVALAFAGGIVGVGLGQAGAHLLTSLVLPGSGLTAAGSVELGLKAMAGAVLVGTFGSIWPALRASALSPATALRNQ